ncbi:MAG: methylated-DNA--[protein]-cysteine S-methyltransferase [Bdellovibrionales bacterium]|nr:methylated-DNA--[protein]-cysteine S-methyltransferase [Bdellovibrionales bacterium]
MNQFQLEIGIGRIAFTWNSKGLLTGIQWEGSRAPESNLTLRFVGRQLSLEGFRMIESFQEYFAHGLPLKAVAWESIDTSALTEFQSQVYRTILRIPHGETRTYAWVAERLGRPNAQRAVGGALRSNPYPVMIPCHRVVAAQGGLGGFMGVTDPATPELVFKKWLLDLEYRYINPTFGFLGESVAS